MSRKSPVYPDALYSELSEALLAVPLLYLTAAMVSGDQRLFGSTRDNPVWRVLMPKKIEPNLPMIGRKPKRVRN